MPTRTPTLHWSTKFVAPFVCVSSSFVLILCVLLFCVFLFFLCFLLVLVFVTPSKQSLSSSVHHSDQTPGGGAHSARKFSQPSHSAAKQVKHNRKQIEDQQRRHNKEDTAKKTQQTHKTRQHRADKFHSSADGNDKAFDNCTCCLLLIVADCC